MKGVDLEAQLSHPAWRFNHLVELWRQVPPGEAPPRATTPPRTRTKQRAEDRLGPDGVAQLRSLQPELLVVAAYGQILSKEVLSVPTQGAINVHGSLLPKYRGAAPVAHAILNGGAPPSEQPELAGGVPQPGAPGAPPHYTDGAAGRSDIAPRDWTFLREWSNNLGVSIEVLLKRILISAIIGQLYAEKIPEI